MPQNGFAAARTRHPNCNQTHCPAILLGVVGLLFGLSGCQGLNSQPFSLGGLSRVPPPGTAAGYPSTGGYYGPNNATSGIAPVGNAVVTNQSGATWNGQGIMPSTDLTAQSNYPVNAYPQGSFTVGNVAPASFNGQLSFAQQGGLNTWSSGAAAPASYAAAPNSNPTSSGLGVSANFRDGNTSIAPATLPGTGSNTALTYPEASDLDWN